jgi:hypothetical protein
VSRFEAEWSVTSETFDDDETTLSMGGDETSAVTWRVTFSASCDSTDATDAGDRHGAALAERESQTDTTYQRVQYLTFDGGCVTSDVSMPLRYDRALVLGAVDASLLLVDRSDLSLEVREQTDGRLGLDP